MDRTLPREDHGHPLAMPESDERYLQPRAAARVLWLALKSRRSEVDWSHFCVESDQAQP